MIIAIEATEKPKRAIICSRKTLTRSYRAKALRFVADDGDAHGCRSLLEDVAVVPLSVARFQVKTLCRSPS